MSKQHATSCGRRIVLESQMRGQSIHETVTAVSEHCNVSLLRAYRIAKGYTLVEVVNLLKNYLRQRGIACEGLAHQMVSRWESGSDSPSERYLDALCYLYQTRPDRLGIGYDYSSPSETNSAGPAHTGILLTARTADLLMFSQTSDSVIQAESYLRAVELVEQRTIEGGYELYTARPADFIPARMVDLANIQGLLLRTQSPKIQRRLHRSAAKNAGFIGIRLTDVGSVHETFNWFGLGRQFAQQAGDAGIEAWIIGHMSDGHSCYGYSLTQGLNAARAAQNANGPLPNSASLFGYLAEAGIQARLGRCRETLDAIRQAERIYGALPEQLAAADGVRIPEYFLRWHQSNALSFIGETRLADPLRRRARELPLGNHDLIGRALLRLDEASLEFAAGEVDAGCQFIKDAWNEAPNDLHIGQITSRTKNILGTLPPSWQISSEVLSVRERLRLPS